MGKFVDVGLIVVEKISNKEYNKAEQKYIDTTMFFW